MTWEELTAVLGQPRGASGGTDKSMNWVWEVYDGVITVTVTLDGGHVVDKQGEWYEPTSLFVKRGLHKIGF
jgi:hypothetical protein